MKDDKLPPLFPNQLEPWEGQLWPHHTEIEWPEEVRVADIDYPEDEDEEG